MMQGVDDYNGNGNGPEQVGHSWRHWLTHCGGRGSSATSRCEPEDQQRQDEDEEALMTI